MFGVLVLASTMCSDGAMIGVIVPIGIGGVVFFGLWFWAILDCISTDSVLIRNLPKRTWLFVVIFVSMPGALAWLLLGRPEGAGLRVGGTYRKRDYTQRPRSKGFEDSAEWQSLSKQIKAPTPLTPSTDDITETTAVKQRRLLEREAELKKREAAKDPDSADDPDPPNGAAD
ncbi:MAG: hypothetical protein ACI88C_000466 [Acidimicrobiales bacterium]|jgi:hypothetical protein